MEVDQFIDLVRAITYKPGWSIEALHATAWETYPGVRLRASSLVPDAYRPLESQMIQFASQENLSENLIYQFDINEAVQYVFSWLLKLERHEASEWFLVDGVRVYDPHKETAWLAPQSVK